MLRTYPFGMVLALLLAAVAVLFAGCGAEGSRETTAERFNAGRAFSDLEAQVDFGPRPSGSQANEKLVGFLAERLREAGAENVGVQRPLRNVVGTIPGRGEGTLVVGAHHDTKDVPGLLGANDGASGVAVVLELARVLAADAPLEGPGISLVLFDGEEARGNAPFDEDGTRGSRQYVELAEHGGRQGAPALSEMEAMVLFDMVGDCELQIPRETGSDAELYGRFEEAAQDVNDSESGAPFGGETGAILDDHVPFAEAGVPAVDLIDFTYGPGGTPGAFWHTTQDTLDKVCPESLDLVGEPAVRVLEGYP